MEPGNIREVERGTLTRARRTARPWLVVWGIEWRIAGARRRLFALNTAIPLVLVLPVALGGAPAGHAAAVYAVLFVLFGTFGAAIPLIRDAGDGILRRIALTGLPPRHLLGERLLAQTLLDTAQLLPALAVIATTGHADTATLLALPAILGAALIAANALGTCIAALARSLAETALFAAVAALLALHGAGVFRTPTPGSVGAWIERAIPFRYLHETLLR
ncbi:MAG TPA: ABC transporter permease, partial [Longimicrobiales bacterium]